jgi:hypothetical protein
MPVNEEKAVWTRTKTVLLPFLPFEAGDTTERRVIDYIANRVIAIARNERRRSHSTRESKLFNFNESGCLIGIDVSSLGNTQSSYLENLLLLSKLYPFALVNCAVAPEFLLKLALTDEFQQKRYILPVHGRLAISDSLYSLDRYGAALFELLGGTTRSIDVGALKGLGVSYRLADLLCRFPGLKVEEGSVTYEPTVFWLGAKSEGMRAALSYLFGNSVEVFDPAKLGADFEIPKTELDGYLEKSMLFDLRPDGQCRFRYLRKHIIPDLMRALTDECDAALAESGAIDTTHSNYAGFTGRFIEYHSVGKLFQEMDTYGLSLLCYAKHCLDHLTYDTICVLDNGKEEGLCKLIPEVFRGASVVRVHNYFGRPVLGAFETIDGGSRVVVFADVVNTGDFLGKVIEMIDQRTGCGVAGVFTVLLNRETPLERFFGPHKIQADGNFCYFIEKKLSNVSTVIKKEHVSRFHSPSGDAFMLFWGMVNQQIKLTHELVRLPIRIPQSAGEIVSGEAVYSFRLGLITTGDGVGGENPICWFLERMLEQSEATAVVFQDRELAQAFGAAIQRMRPGVVLSTWDANESSFSDGDALRRQKRFLVLGVAVGTGSRMNSIVRQLSRHLGFRPIVRCVSLLSRQNAIEDTKVFTNEGLAEVEKVTNTIHTFYQSRLPYYFISQGMASRQKIIADLTRRVTRP